MDVMFFFCFAVFLNCRDKVIIMISVIFIFFVSTCIESRSFSY